MAIKSKKKLKRPFSPKHLKALRAAHAKRRGKKRGKYKADVNSIDSSLIEALTNYDVTIRQECVRLANASSIHKVDAQDFLKFVNDIFNYIKTGNLPTQDKSATETASAEPKEPKTGV